jgi:alpha-N-arabinofuranosidase
MANIAQTVNVLQAMILTDGAQMLLTPTYHVFEMYKVHQDATLLPTYLKSDEYRLGGAAIPAISASASRGVDGVINVSLCHTAPGQSATVEVDLRGTRPYTLRGRVLAPESMNAHNTFENRNSVRPRVLTSDELRLDEGKLFVTLPLANVAVIQITPLKPRHSNGVK